MGALLFGSCTRTCKCDTIRPTATKGYTMDITKQCELSFQGCDKPAKYVSTVQTANYRESSYFCEDHKDAGYVPGKLIVA